MKIQKEAPATAQALGRRRAVVLAVLLALGLVALYFLRLELAETVALTSDDPVAAYRRLYRLASAVLVAFGLVLAVAGLGLLRAAFSAWHTQRLRAVLAAVIGLVALAAAVAVPLVALRHVAFTLAAAHERNQPQLDWQLRGPAEESEQEPQGESVEEDNPPSPP